MKKSIKTFIITTLSVAFIVSLTLVFQKVLAWTNPTQNPPGGAGVLNVSSGNVGIGTATPASKLDINGRFRTVGDSVPTSGTGLEFAWTGTQGAIFAYDRTTPGYKDVGIGVGATQLYLKNDGNVGIGTTAPNGLLQVSNGTSATWATSGNATGKLIIGKTVDTVLAIGSTASGYVWMQSQAADAAQVTYPIVLQPLGGSVGIGTASPGSLLHLYGASGATTEYVKFTSADGGDIRVGKQTGVNNNAIFGTWTNNDVNFYANSAVGMTLQTTGNVGIGTASPAAKLHVDGGQTYLVYNHASSPALDVRNASGGPAAVFGASGGNVGIGTTNPTQALHIGDSRNIQLGVNDGVGGSLFFRRINSQTNPTVPTNGAGIYYNWDATNNEQLSFNLAGSERMVINLSGNVGIGTTAPGAKLDVYGDIKTSCPTGTTDYGVYCLEDSYRGPNVWYVAYKTCRNLGRRLPFGVELATRDLISAAGSCSCDATGKQEEWVADLSCGSTNACYAPRECTGSPWYCTFSLTGSPLSGPSMGSKYYRCAVDKTLGR